MTEERHALKDLAAMCDPQPQPKAKLPPKLATLRSAFEGAEKRKDFGIQQYRTEWTVVAHGDRDA